MSWEDIQCLHELQLCFGEVFQQGKLCKVGQKSDTNLKQTPESHDERWDVSPCGKSPKSGFEDHPIFLRIKPFLSGPTGQHYPAHPCLGGEVSVSLHPGETLLLLHPHRPHLCCGESGSSPGRSASEMCLTQDAAERRASLEKTFTWSCWSANLPLPSVADVITRISCYSAFIIIVICIQNWIISQYLLWVFIVLIFI